MDRNIFDPFIGIKHRHCHCSMTICMHATIYLMTIADRPCQEATPTVRTQLLITSDTTVRGYVLRSCRVVNRPKILEAVALARTVSKLSLASLRNREDSLTALNAS